MSTKKIILIIAGVFAVLALIVALFVGGIVWFVFHTIGNSEAAETARTFLRNNEILKQRHWRGERLRFVCHRQHQRTEHRRRSDPES